MPQAARAIKPTKREIIQATLEIIDTRNRLQRQKLEAERQRLQQKVMDLQKEIGKALESDSILSTRDRHKLDRLRKSGATVDKRFFERGPELTVHIDLKQLIKLEIPTPEAVVKRRDEIQKIELRRTELYKQIEALHFPEADPLATIIRRLPAEYLPHLEKLAEGIAEILVS